jgi:hypothetical protein
MYRSCTATPQQTALNCQDLLDSLTSRNSLEFKIGLSFAVPGSSSLVYCLKLFLAPYIILIRVFETPFRHALNSVPLP